MPGCGFRWRSSGRACRCIWSRCGCYPFARKPSKRARQPIESSGMKMNAAVLWDVHEDWSVEEIDLDGPKEGEVLVSYEATGWGNSDHPGAPGAFPLLL